MERSPPRITEIDEEAVPPSLPHSAVPTQTPLSAIATESASVTDIDICKEVSVPGNLKYLIGKDDIGEDFLKACRSLLRIVF